MTSDITISAEGLQRRFGAVRAVDDVSLAVRQGEIYGFLGPNGAGKSTCVRMLTTLLKPTGGRATVAGFDVATQSNEVRLRIGAALQEAALDPKQTGRELLRLQGRLYGLSADLVKRRIADLSTLVDIGDAMDRLIGTYSSGMKRRLDLAASLVHNPEVLFLDEPTTGLDPISRAKVWREVRRINRDMSVTIFLTTQYLEEADALADCVGIINAGKIAAEGTPMELKRSIGNDLIIARVEGDAEKAATAVREMRMVEKVETHGGELTISASNGTALISNVALALNASGVSVRELTVRTPTLDDVFLRVTGARLEDEATRGEAKDDGKLAAAGQRHKGNRK
ncbi:MAG: ATP-binding cassette domain-containing protein [SAR202 cluster bacterium]|nr:ATP-binding cassette domain-containing protein [SAR202 cluster bacterium]